MNYSAVWCLRGSGVYHDQDGIAWPMRPGTLFHRFPDRTHSTTLDPGRDWAECFIELTAPLALGLAAADVLDPRRPVQHPGIDLGLVTELSELVDAVRAAPDRDLPLLTARLIGILLSLCTRDLGTEADDPQRDLVDRACRRLTDDPRLGLATLARELGLSYERFRKVFRERVGISPGEYRIRRRIDSARALLQSPTRAVKEVAEELGYPNPYAFSAQFKLVVGESPEAFRRRH
jgi:AraC-like DNA-binding protein